MKRGKEFIELLRDHRRQDCPVCKRGCTTIALVKLVYAFEPCDCGTPTYTHLIETLYHRECFKRLPAKDNDGR